MSYNKETGLYEGYIYCIENLVNGKKYIGYTKNDLETRWQQHLSKAHHREDHSILHLAIDKYKEYNFTIYSVKVVQCDTSEELIKQLKLAEKECVKEYNTITPNGYNILQGGETVPINRITPVYQYTMSGEFIASFRSITEAIQVNDLDDNPRSSKLARHLHTDHCAFGYLWDKEPNDNIVDTYQSYKKHIRQKESVRINARSKSVLQLDLHMNIVNVFDSITCASKATGFFTSVISQACRGYFNGSHYGKGFLWMFLSDYNNQYL